MEGKLGQARELTRDRKYTCFLCLSCPFYFYFFFLLKDLHRTGCSSYCGQEAEQDRVVLKRVLLAYARWNKSVGYCQGFNILAALILEVMEGNEGDALKVSKIIFFQCQRLLLVSEL